MEKMMNAKINQAIQSQLRNFQNSMMMVRNMCVLQLTKSIALSLAMLLQYIKHKEVSGVKCIVSSTIPITETCKESFYILLLLEPKKNSMSYVSLRLLFRE